MSANWNVGSKGSNFIGRVDFEDEAANIEAIFDHEQEPHKKGDVNGLQITGQLIPVAGFRTFTLSGINTFRLVYRSGKKNKQATMWDARLEIKRVK